MNSGQPSRSLHRMSGRQELALATRRRMPQGRKRPRHAGDARL